MMCCTYDPGIAAFLATSEETASPAMAQWLCLAILALAGFWMLIAA